jgi:transketolase
MIRIDSIKMTEASKSGHPTSCASLADLLACLFFSPNGLRINLEDLSGYENERLVLSKGHAAPALYSAWCLAGYLEREEIMKLR